MCPVRMISSLPPRRYGLSCTSRPMPSHNFSQWMYSALPMHKILLTMPQSMREEWTIPPIADYLPRLFIYLRCHRSITCHDDGCSLRRMNQCPYRSVSGRDVGTTQSECARDVTMVAMKTTTTVNENEVGLLKLAVCTASVRQGRVGL